MIRAIFFDIDGTLVSLSTHRIPESAKQALNALRGRGIRLFICSGRPLCAIDNLEEQTFDGFITVNGGICTYNGEVIHRNPIVRPDIESWKSYTRQHNGEGFYITEDRVFMSSRCEATAQFIDLLNFITPEIRTLDELGEEPIFQMVGLFGQEEDEMVTEALPHCRLTRWHPTFSDIIPDNSNKSIGIKALLAHTGIRREECMAFGDGSNDMEMLRFVGTGIAMGGSGSNVIEAADYVTTPTDEDGIWNALRHFSVI